MAMKLSIADESVYKNAVENCFDSILNSRLMSIKTNLLSDDDIMATITDYDKSEKEKVNNYCTWLTIGDVKQSNYNGNDYYYVNLLSNEEIVMQINLSQFIYEMSTYDRNISHFASFDASNSGYVCLIDGHKVDPYSFLKENKGKKMLLYFSFQTVTQYNKIKECYYFAFEKVTPSDIRRYILQSQKSTLEAILDNPDTYAPSTTMKIEVEGFPNAQPSYHHHMKTQSTYKFVCDIFNNSYKEAFEARLEEVEAEMNKL